MREIVKRHQVQLQTKGQGSHWCPRDAVHQLYSGTITASLQAAFEANPCVQVVEALNVVSSASLRFSTCRTNCGYNLQGLQNCAERLLRELVTMTEELPWE